MRIPFAEVFENAPADHEEKRKLFIVISSDKGLCGGIHSSVSKFTRRAINDGEHPVDADSPLVVIGDKSKAQLVRALPKNLALTVNQIGRDVPTFADAAGVADLIVKSGVKYDSVAIVYNRFVSAISYESDVVEVLNESGLKQARTCLILAALLQFLLMCVCYSWLQSIRDGGRCHQRPRRVRPCQRHLCRSH